MNRLKPLHVVFLAITSMVIMVPPAKASLIQVIQLIYTEIQTLLGGYNAIIQQQNAAGQTTINSHKMSADTLGGIIAEQTKTLGTLEQKLNFGSFGSQGEFRIDAIAPSGCFSKKSSTDFKNWAKAKEKATKETWPSINAYAAVRKDIDFGQDRSDRRGIFQRAKELGLLEMGLYPTRKLNSEEYEIWVEMIKYLTVPQPISEDGALSPANKLRLIQENERYKQMVGIVQSSLLRNALLHKKLDGDISREEMLLSYEVYANSFKRTRSSNLKTENGLAKELAEANARALDVQLELNETNEAIESLLTILAIESTDNFAKRINK